MIDVYLFESATGRLVRRMMADVEAIDAALDADHTLDSINYKPGTSDATHEVDLATGRLRIKE